MCDHCKHLGQHLEVVLHGHISSLIDAFTIASDQDWELSEPLLVGGPPGAYKVQAPFVGDCQWSIDQASAGASTTSILASSSQIASNFTLDYTGASGQQFSGVGTPRILAINVPANSNVPVLSKWYNTADSQNNVFFLFTASANAAFANIVFRQKRMAKRK